MGSSLICWCESCDQMWHNAEWASVRNMNLSVDEHERRNAGHRVFAGTIADRRDMDRQLAIYTEVVRRPVSIHELPPFIQRRMLA